MRNCQICGNSGKNTIQENYNSQPMNLYECANCGHWYVDGLELSQAWFDEYYLTQYRTDDKPYSHARLNSLADFISSFGVPRASDIGGTDYELAKRLGERGILCVPFGVGFKMVEDCLVIMSHVLEHVYDINELFGRVNAEFLVVEIPIHLGYNVNYDVHWQHINKFRPQDVGRLFTEKGYTVRVSKQIEDYREYKVWRIAGVK